MQYKVIFTDKNGVRSETAYTTEYAAENAIRQEADKITKPLHRPFDLVTDKSSVTLINLKTKRVYGKWRKDWLSE